MIPLSGRTIKSDWGHQETFYWPQSVICTIISSYPKRKVFQGKIVSARAASPLSGVVRVNTLLFVDMLHHYTYPQLITEYRVPVQEINTNVSHV